MDSLNQSEPKITMISRSTADDLKPLHIGAPAERNEMMKMKTLLVDMDQHRAALAEIPR